MIPVDIVAGEIRGSQSTAQHQARVLVAVPLQPCRSCGLPFWPGAPCRAARGGSPWAVVSKKCSLVRRTVILPG